MNKFIQARTEEIKYHETFYSYNVLFEPGTWLAKPVKIVMDMLELFNHNEIQILDLGCGVGRNSIPIAQKLKNHQGIITCVDLIPTAIEHLIENSKKYDVHNQIIAEIADAELFLIKPNGFDYIIACSCLEHLSSVDAFRIVVNRMIEGTKENGINTILMSTEIEELDIETGEINEGLIELNLKTEETFALLQELYEDWEILFKRYLPQTIDEMKYGKEIEFRSNWITFVARRKGGIS
ncbi:class I SAM-dependent methyltransferase [Cohnella endophytica]|uniref:Class I SAM-dependent methyltransferase n=1 Tax=Cohnella endophytica TaxID=2419778 RepID=A0A494Y5I8_9BACL|nr:class I SAM-dependent methyltransferase [Cohnella endophytica]RKP57960.1 class I SAM-dependent methyltransferase [Cohnella endophytica]